MELGKQIKRYRTKAGLSQEDLADKVYVSRQTISNWENDKSYPDVKSLMLLSEIFEISIDNLIKGDLDKMKREIDTQEYAQFQKDSIIFTIMLAGLILLPIPLVAFLQGLGVAIVIVWVVVSMVYAGRVEKYKKKYDVQTYKEILAFTEGKSLDEIEKAKEVGKRPYQKVFYVVGCMLLTILVSAGMMALLHHFQFV